MYDILSRGAAKTVGGQSQPLERGDADDDQRFTCVASRDTVYPRRSKSIRKPA